MSFFDAEVKSNEILYLKTNPGRDWLENPRTDRFVRGKGPMNIKKSKSVWSFNSFDLKDIPDGITLKILEFGVDNVLKYKLCRYDMELLRTGFLFIPN